MKRTPLRQVSNKQKKELALRSKLKKELIQKQIDVIGYAHCMTCGTRGDIRGLSLSHIIPLGRLGKTTRDNTLLECFICHEKYEKHPERRSK